VHLVKKPTGEWVHSHKPFGLDALAFQDKKDKANLNAAKQLKGESNMKKTSTMGDEKTETVRALRKTIKEMSADDFEDFDLEMKALLKKAYALVEKLAAS
jgi:hypothetical protein